MKPAALVSGQVARHERKARKSLRRRRVLRLGGLATCSVLALGSWAGPTKGRTATASALRQASTSASHYLVINAYVGVNPTPTSSLNVYSPNNLGLNDYVLAPLAVAQPPRFGVYLPKLATSWKATPSTVTIHLRTDAKWQNGQPVTSKDVTTTYLLDGVDGNGLWSDITGMTAPDAHTVVLDVKKGISPSLVLNTALTVYPVSSSVYGQFLIPHLETDLLRNAASPTGGSSASSTSPAAKAISGVLKKLDAFNPKTVVGDGPFEYVTRTTQSATFKKWNGFWGASKVHVPGIQALSVGANSEIWADFLGGKMDFAPTGITYAVTQRIEHTPNEHVAYSDFFQEFSAYFNDHHYPFTMPGVRRAIAYLINRKELAEATSGHSPNQPYPWVHYPTGVYGSIERQWLTSKQLHSLNPYLPDPAKAARILKGLGFHKRNGQWIMPNGKPFTLTVFGDSEGNEWTAGAPFIAHSLTAFGIKTTARLVAATAFLSGIETGAYQLGLWVDWNVDFQPLSGLEYTLSGVNYSATGKGLEYGPIETVPGLGRVNVSHAILKEYNTVGPGPEMRKLIWTWARFINKQMPYLSLWDRSVVTPYSTAHFVGWPAKSSPQWALAGPEPGSGLVQMIESGELRPRS